MYNNNYYQQPQNFYQQRQPQVPSVSLKGRPVSSIDEARASLIDFDGSVFYFPDLANRKIYTKQINPDGTATLNMYELKEIPMTAVQQTNNNYITREEFEKAIAELKKTVPENYEFK